MPLAPPRQTPASQKWRPTVLRWGGVCLALMAAGCIQARPTKEDIFGRWVVDRASNANQARATLEFKDDGTFVASALPADIVEMGDQATPVDTSGRWRLSTRGDAQVIQMDFVLPDGQGGRKVWGNQLDFMGSSRSLGLYFTRGDPENDERLVFRRPSQ